MKPHSSRAAFFGLALAALAASAGGAGCLSNSNSDSSHPGSGADASADGGPLGSVTTGGNVGVDGGGGASLAHAGFGIVSGGVRAQSSAHVLVTSTGQAPGGNGAMHSAGHTVVGGVAGATQ